MPQIPNDQPTSFANGRYQVQRFLDEGGKKKGYLVHDTALDREAAFSLIKTEGLDETSRTRIQREAHQVPVHDATGRMPSSLGMASDSSSSDIAFDLSSGPAPPRSWPPTPDCEALSIRMQGSTTHHRVNEAALPGPAQGIIATTEEHYETRG